MEPRGRHSRLASFEKESTWKGFVVWIISLDLTIKESNPTLLEESLLIASEKCNQIAKAGFYQTLYDPL